MTRQPSAGAPLRPGREDIEVWLNRLTDGLGELGAWAIDRLAEYDLAHKGELVSTLRAFLNESRPGEAAARLFIHRNTLRYRLQTIKELTHLDPKDRTHQILLQLQLRRWERATPVEYI